MNQQYLINDGSEINLPELSKDDLWDDNGFYNYSQFEFVPSSDQDFPTCLEDEPKTYIDLQPIDKNSSKSRDLHQFTNDKLKQTLLKRQSEKTAKQAQAQSAISSMPSSQQQICPSSQTKLECSNVLTSAVPIAHKIQSNHSEGFRQSFSNTATNSPTSYQQSVDNHAIRSQHQSDLSNTNNGPNAAFPNEQTVPLPNTSSASISTNSHVTEQNVSSQPPQTEVLTGSLQSSANAAKSNFNIPSPEDATSQQLQGISTVDQGQNRIDVHNHHKPDEMTAEHFTAPVIQQSQIHHSNHEQSFTALGNDVNNVHGYKRKGQDAEQQQPQQEVSNVQNSFDKSKETSYVRTYQVQETVIPSQKSTDAFRLPYQNPKETQFEMLTSPPASKNVQKMKQTGLDNQAEPTQQLNYEIVEKVSSSSSTAVQNPSQNPSQIPPVGPNFSVQQLQFQQSHAAPSPTPLPPLPLSSLRKSWKPENPNSNMMHSVNSPGQQSQHGTSVSSQRYVADSANPENHDLLQTHHNVAISFLKNKPNSESKYSFPNKETNLPSQNRNYPSKPVKQAVPEPANFAPYIKLAHRTYQTPPPPSFIHDSSSPAHWDKKCAKLDPNLQQRFQHSPEFHQAPVNNLLIPTQQEKAIMDRSKEANSFKYNEITVKKSPFMSCKTPQLNSTAGPRETAENFKPQNSHNFTSSQKSFSAGMLLNVPTPQAHFHSHIQSPEMYRSVKHEKPDIQCSERKNSAELTEMNLLPHYIYQGNKPSEVHYTTKLHRQMPHQSPPVCPAAENVVPPNNSSSSRFTNELRSLPTTTLPHQPHSESTTETISHTLPSLQYSNAVSTSSFTCSQTYTSPLLSISTASEFVSKADTVRLPKIQTPATTSFPNPAIEQNPVQTLLQSAQSNQQSQILIENSSIKNAEPRPEQKSENSPSCSLTTANQNVSFGNTVSTSVKHQQSLTAIPKELQFPFHNKNLPASDFNKTSSKSDSIGEQKVESLENKINNSKTNSCSSLFGHYPQVTSDSQFTSPRFTVINNSIYSSYSAKSASPSTTFSNESKLNKKDGPNVNVSNHEWLERLERLRTNTKVEVPQCDCPTKDENGSDRNPYYTHLGTGPTVAAVRQTMEKRFQVQGEAIRIEKLIYTGKEGKTSQGCPLAKWIIRRAGPEEKYLILLKHRNGHRCATAWIVIGIVAWEGVPGPFADDLYSMLVYKLTRFGLPTQRRCGINEQRTCACQGMDRYSGASFSFGCSWSMYYNGCKYARSKTVHKFKLSEQSEEAEVEERLQDLATNLAPVYKQVAPDSYNNQVEFEKSGTECRLGRKVGRPWSGVTACVDFCAHAHKDLHNMNNGCTVVVTLTKHRGFAKPDDEQLHVLPLYVIDGTDENGSREGQQRKVKNGSLESLKSYPVEMRIRNNPLTPCRKKGRKKKDDGSTTPKEKDAVMSPPFSTISPGKEPTNKSPRWNGKTCNAATKRKELHSKRLLFPQQNYNLLSPMNQECYQQNVNENLMRNSSPRISSAMPNLHSQPVTKLPMKFSPEMRNGSVTPYPANAIQHNRAINSHAVPQSNQIPDIPNGNLTSLQILSEVVAIAHEQMMAANSTHSEQPAVHPSQHGSCQMAAQKIGYGSGQQAQTLPVQYDAQLPNYKNSWKNGMSNYFPNNPLESSQQCDQNRPTASERCLPANQLQVPSSFHHNTKIPAANNALPLEQHRSLQQMSNSRDKLVMQSNAARTNNGEIVTSHVPSDNITNPYMITDSGKMQFMNNSLPGLPNRAKETVSLNAGLSMQQYFPFFRNNLNQFLPPNVAPFIKEEKFDAEMDYVSPPGSPPSEEKDPNGFFELHSDNEESFHDNSVGGVAIALSHGSVLFECAKHELHATTALKKPSRLQPTRISLVFYQHKNMNVRCHGWNEYEKKMEQKRQEENGYQDVPFSPSPRKKLKQETPPCIKSVPIPTRQITTASTTSWITVFPFSPLIVTGPYQKWI